ncbi:DUF2934 domain-containing protein [Candidatus Peregrinibacteria bacterium]|nr:DUF2934 domain-containing protein [Candidatus Peregrinibacteria bacterium]
MFVPKLETVSCSRWEGRLANDQPVTMEMVSRQNQALRRALFDCCSHPQKWDVAKYREILEKHYLREYVLRAEAHSSPSAYDIDRLAHQYYESRGCEHGHDVEDHNLAEQEFRDGKVLAGMLMQSEAPHYSAKLYAQGIDSNVFYDGNQRLPRLMTDAARQGIYQESGRFPDFYFPDPASIILDARTHHRILAEYYGQLST